MIVLAQCATDGCLFLRQQGDDNRKAGTSMKLLHDTITELVEVTASYVQHQAEMPDLLKLPSTTSVSLQPRTPSPPTFLKQMLTKPPSTHL